MQLELGGPVHDVIDDGDRLYAIVGQTLTLLEWTGDHLEARSTLSLDAEYTRFAR